MALTPYMIERLKMKNGGKKTKGDARKEAAARGEFFQQMIAKAPKKCMESGKPLGDTMAMIASAVVAHILPKSKFKSIAEHPLNIVYLHGDVHTDMDNKGEGYVVKMKIFPLLRSRVADLWESIDLNELKHVPKYLNPLNIEYDREISGKTGTAKGSAKK